MLITTWRNSIFNTDRFVYSYFPIHQSLECLVIFSRKLGYDKMFNFYLKSKWFIEMLFTSLERMGIILFKNQRCESGCPLMITQPVPRKSCLSGRSSAPEKQSREPTLREFHVTATPVKSALSYKILQDFLRPVRQDPAVANGLNGPPGGGRKISLLSNHTRGSCDLFGRVPGSGLRSARRRSWERFSEANLDLGL